LSRGVESAGRARRVLLGLAILVLGAGALEVSARLVDRARGSPWSGERSRAKVATLRAALTAPWIAPESSSDPRRHREDLSLQPFTGWQSAEIQARIADDLDAYRRPESASIYDVCLLGGSGAVALASEGGAGLVEMLARDPRLAGREIRLHPYGIEDTKQPQAERLLAYLLSLGHRPDAVIELDGVDEAAIGWSNALAGTSPLYPSAGIWAELTEGLRMDWEVVELLHELHEARASAVNLCRLHLGLRLDRSCLLDHAGSLLLARQRGKVEEAESEIRAYLGSRAREAELMGPRTSTDPEEVVRTIVTCWEEAAIDMHALCARRGIAYLHVLEPAPSDRDQGAPTPNEGVGRVHPRLRDAGKRLAERGIAFLDGASVLADHPEMAPLGSDRLGGSGLEILAEAAARALPVR